MYLEPSGKVPPGLIDHWVKSFAESAYAKTMGEPYRRRHTDRVKRLLAKGSTEILTLRNVYDKGLWLGFCVFRRDPQTIHYLYVKKSFRKMGFSRELVAHCNFNQNLPVYYSHRVGILRKVRLPPTWIWDEFSFE